MKLVTVEDLKEGDVIANDVLLDDYTVVLSKGTVIKAPYIDKLRELQVFTVYIEEAKEESVEPIVKNVKLTPKENKAPVKKTQPEQKNHRLKRKRRKSRRKRKQYLRFLWKKLQFCAMKWKYRSQIK